ncbi:MAG: hypothetical protein H8D80_01210 [Proteobacteria bacterium]|nr:hypothetical protein [Pseudomonadota bacterium]
MSMDNQTLEKRYNELCNSPSDINEHLPTLKRYAEECGHITEMGVREIVSTYALLIGQPKTLVSIDIIHPTKFGASLEDIVSFAKEMDVNFKFCESDTLSVDIDETDLLFIDTKHNYYQLKGELKRHGNKAFKYIIFHDTFLFENRDETSDQPSDKSGLLPAIDEFLETNSHWSCHEVFENNNGLTILKRRNTQ